MRQCRRSLVCETDPQNGLVAECQLENITASNIGVTNMTTNLSPQPFTWTIGESENRSLSTITVSRDFYLGTASSIDLEVQSLGPNCAIFFHGIAPVLHFPGPGGVDQGQISGSCEDALTAPCVSALQSQVAAFLATNTTMDCSSLAAFLQSTPPLSCPAQNGGWGEVSGKCKLNSLLLGTCY